MIPFGWRRARHHRHAILSWGSFEAGKYLTVGDAHAVENVSRGLRDSGFEHCIVSKGEYDYGGVPIVSDVRQLGENVETLIFVCGPLHPDPRLLATMQRLQKARKFAFGVSVLAEHAEFTRSFDGVLARDGTGDAAFDLAPARFAASPLPTPNPAGTVGLCFVGQQREYGSGRHSLDGDAEALLASEAKNTGLGTHVIDTVLRPTNNARVVLAAFQRAGIVATTRLHGSLYALLHGRPPLAMDQIPGRAKVSDLLARINWPYVFGIESVEREQVRDAFRAAQTPAIAEHVGRARDEAIRRSQAALREALTLVLQ